MDRKIHFQAITVQEAQKLYMEEMTELDDMRHQIHQPCKEVLDCRLVAKRLTNLFYEEIAEIAELSIDEVKALDEKVIA